MINIVKIGKFYLKWYRLAAKLKKPPGKRVQDCLAPDYNLA